jgi:hypothetical protein
MIQRLPEVLEAAVRRPASTFVGHEFLLLLVLLVSSTNPAEGVDRTVTIRCVGTTADCSFEIEPNPVVLVAGQDRVHWSLPETCACAMGPTIEICLWDPPFHCAYAAWSGGATPFTGPLCELGTFEYYAGIRGSHGEIQYGRTAQIEVVARAPESPSEIVTPPRIGMFADSTASSCSLIWGAGNLHRAWIFAVFDGPADCALLGAEFRITGFPEDWRVSSIEPNTSGYSRESGRALMTVGERIDFPFCQGSQAGAVLLYVITYATTTQFHSQTIRIEGSVESGSPCPRVTLCDGAARTATCAVGGFAYVNVAPAPCWPHVAASRRTWTSVKSLY